MNTYIKNSILLIYLCTNFNTATRAIPPVPQDTANTPLKVCTDHYPPYSIYLAKQTVPIGTLVSTAQIIANRLKVDIQFTKKTPFKRCLLMMRTGEVDAMFGLLGSESRDEYMHMLQYLSHSNKSFYTLTKSNIQVINFNDLAGYNIGMIAGFNYFTQFDNEQNLFNKISSKNTDLSFKRLISERLDIVISTDRQMEFFLTENPEYRNRIKRLKYNVKEPNAVYMGISRKSAYIDKVNELEDILSNMMISDEFNTITKDFIKNQSKITATQ